jgi:hypothetical protein
MAVIKAASLERETRSKREIYAEVCYYYPQYTLKDAQLLPARDIALLLVTAHRVEARNNYNLTQIAAAPHTKKGEGVKKLLDHFKQVST